MAGHSQLLDQWGQPVRRSVLRQEVAGPSLSGTRSPLTGYPGDNLDPRKLAAILRSADAGDPIRYLELAETIEERDPHYLGVLGTRRRSVSQLDITVEEGSDDAADVKIAEEIRAWLRRDELTDEIFDVLDAIGKGYSFTEILWDYSSGQWQPDRLEWRDPRWFEFDRTDLRTPRMRKERGDVEPLPAFKFIDARIRAKSGVPTRSGLARVVMWPYLFKKFTERDWSIFSQTYGQPLRLGKFGPGASKRDRETLMRAVANIAGDCAAIIPESMQIEFIETGNLSASTSLYEDRADWYDKQVSKAVLGQTATTDAEVGGLGSGTEHRMVQEDIERADARALAAILNRDLIRPWVHLNHGARPRYPRLVIARPEAEDLERLSKALAPLIDRGFEVSEDELRSRFGLKKPDAGAKILRPAGKMPPTETPDPEAQDAMASEAAVKYPLNTLSAQMRAMAQGNPKGPSAGDTEPLADSIDRLGSEAAPQVGAMIDQVAAMIERATDLEELRAMMMEAWPTLDQDGLAGLLGEAFVAANLGGRAMVVSESDA